jgi:hypothetical protein
MAEAEVLIERRRKGHKRKAEKSCHGHSGCACSP